MNSTISVVQYVLRYQYPVEFYLASYEYRSGAHFKQFHMAWAKKQQPAPQQPQGRGWLTWLSAVLAMVFASTSRLLLWDLAALAL